MTPELEDNQDGEAEEQPPAAAATATAAAAKRGKKRNVNLLHHVKLHVQNQKRDTYSS